MGKKVTVEEVRKHVGSYIKFKGLNKVFNVISGDDSESEGNFNKLLWNILTPTGNEIKLRLYGGTPIEYEFTTKDEWEQSKKEYKYVEQTDEELEQYENSQEYQMRVEGYQAKRIDGGIVCIIRMCDPNFCLAEPSVKEMYDMLDDIEFRTIDEAELYLINNL